MMEPFLMLPVVIHIHDCPFYYRGDSIVPDTTALVVVLCGHLLAQGSENRHFYKGNLYFLREGEPLDLIPGEDSAFAIIYIENLYLMSLVDFHPVTIIPNLTIPLENIRKNRSIQTLFSCYFKKEFPQADELMSAFRHFSDDLLPMLIPDLSVPESSVLVTHLMYILNQRYFENLSLTTIADELHVIPPYVSSLCRKKLGTGFHEALTRRRVARAGALLRYTDLNITQICALCGFPNPKSFYQAFGSRYQMTPKSFRSKERTANIPVIVCDNVTYEDDRERYWNYLDSDSYIPLNTSAERLIKGDMANAQDFSFSTADILYAGNAANLLSTTCIANIRRIISTCKIRFVRLNKLFSEDRETQTTDFGEANHILNSLRVLGLYPMISCLIIPFRHTDDCVIQFFNYILRNYGIDDIGHWKLELIPHKRNLTNPAALENVSHQILRIFQYIKSMIPSMQIGLNIFSTEMDVEISLKVCRELLALYIVPDFEIANLYPLNLISQSSSTVDENGFPSAGRKYLSENPSFNFMHLKHFVDATEQLYAGVKHKHHWIANTVLDLDGNNLLNETLFATTFFMMNVLQCQSLADEFILPIISQKYHFRYHKKNGLLQGVQSLFTSDNIQMPLLFALHLLDAVGSRLVSMGPRHLITVAEGGTISCLLVNYKHPSRYFCMHPHLTSQNDVESIFYNYPSDKVTLDIRLKTPAAFLYEEIFINHEHGSFIDFLLKAGSIQSLNPAIIDHMINLNHPAYSLGTLPKTDRIRLQKTLTPQEIRLIRLFPDIPEQ